MIGRISFARFRRSEEGAAMVEFAIVVVLFFFVMLVTFDFGRLAFAHVGSDTAVRMAARLAAVRPPACDDVPERLSRGETPVGSQPPRFGTACRTAGWVCETVDPIECRGDAGNATAQYIYSRVAALLPAGTAVDSLLYTYSQDNNLGFLGGPYSPIVTVQLIDRTKEGTEPLAFQFITPIGNATGITLPTFSTSLPGEDLNTGDAG
jgi:Flp pilus assembly pilin Flp